MQLHLDPTVVPRKVCEPAGTGNSGIIAMSSGGLCSINSIQLWYLGKCVSPQERETLAQEVEKAVSRPDGRADPAAIDAINAILIETPQLVPLAVYMLKAKMKSTDCQLALIALDAIDLLMLRHGTPVQREVMENVLQRVLKISIPTTFQLTNDQMLVKRRAGWS